MLWLLFSKAKDVQSSKHIFVTIRVFLQILGSARLCNRGFLSQKVSWKNPKKILF